MVKKQPAVDGFIPRRSPGVIGVGGERHAVPKVAMTNLRRRSVVSEDVSDKQAHGLNAGMPMQHHGLTRLDIDTLPQDIDRQPSAKHKKRPFSIIKRRSKVIKWAIIIVLLAVVGCGVWVTAKAFIAGKSVFKGDIFGLVQQKKLQQDAGGRTNILILGTSEDDPGHDAGYLTDSMMILSVDQTNKNAYMVSVPRDLYVQYGRACDAGYAGKINAYYNCVNSGTATADEEDRQTAERSFVGKIFGLDIQYSVHVNYTVMRDVVNAVGPITVNIQGDGADGIMDSNFDWKCKKGNANASHATMVKECPPNGHFIDYPNGPATLDAEHALYLAQARGDVEPTYGLANSNFDREQNQQKIIIAIKEKAMSTGTLTNIGKVTQLIDALGNNLRTNFYTSEIRTLITLGQSIPSSAITSVNMLDATPALFTNKTMPGAGSSVLPAAGTYDYSQIQAFIKKQLYATAITKEDSHVIVLNATGVAGVAQTEANKLTALGMTVDAVGNAPSDFASATNVIYQVGSTVKTQTSAKLTSLYGTTPKAVTSVPGVTIGDDTDYVVMLVSANASTSSDASAQ